MKNRKYIGFVLTLLIIGIPSIVFAQEKTEKTKKVNFDYSANPPVREASVKPGIIDSKTDKTANNSGEKPAKTISGKDSGNSADKDGAFEDLTEDRGPVESGNVTIARKTREIAKNAATANLPATEIYKVGISDVLFISLQNAAVNASKYYTVLNDGTIDYPLAGEMVSVIGLTTDQIEDLLRKKIKLYENPEVTVKVREHASHKISVIGAVERSGEKFLQREAMPLFVIRAEAMVDPDATWVTVKRKDLDPQIFELTDEKYQSFLIYPGDIVEFGKEESKPVASAGNFYFIGGFVRQFGRKDYFEGLTLTQAILASGGLRESKIRKITIRRKNTEGLLESHKFDLREIKDGKVPDPQIEPGDTIESEY
ncbi:MAG: polysaccharide biosynthesis/export family protein [Pyrinomonadaceae bacterium]